ncbi:hypothetical protein B0T21DRAFT_408141 [Apiosordaria backusii]|uniref:Uncharacterized protein n=1 Tax=Apiosordaria backusii TaxID=314023 RepID=A0AA40ET83_9PEZI|nr:hypothetical protein B0T21DRAFT_408141 [Apiosordaria backusii]
MAAEEDPETRGILVTAPRQRSPTLRTYSRKRSSNQLPSLKPSQRQFPVRPLQQVQLNLRVTKRSADASKLAEQPLVNRIEVALPGKTSFDPREYDDAYVGGDEDEDLGDIEEEEESENDHEILSITNERGHTAAIQPYTEPDICENPDDSEGQKENHTNQIVIPSRTPRFTQQLIRGRPPGNGPRRPHLIFNKLPTRNRFKKLPQKPRNKRQISALRSHPGDGFSDSEVKRAGLVLPIRSGKPTTSDTHVGELDISRAPPLPKHKRDLRRANLGDDSFDNESRKKTKHTQEATIVILDDHQVDQSSSPSTKSTIFIGQKPDIPRQTSQSILHPPRAQPSQPGRSTPPRTIPTQILIPSLRHNPRSNLPHRVVIHPPTSEEDPSEDDSTYAPDDEMTIPNSSDIDAQTESGVQQDNSGYETYISETSPGGQRSSSVTSEPIPYSKKQEDSTVGNVDAGVQVTQGLTRRRELKRCITQ